MSGWLGNLPLAASAALFLGAAAVVWLSGTRLARLADAIACRTGIGQATLGVLLLGGVGAAAILAGPRFLMEVAALGVASVSDSQPPCKATRSS